MFNYSNKLDRMLTKCIRSIEEKGWTVEDCLGQYRSYRKELEPMLRTALRLRRAREFSPSTTFRRDAQNRIRRRLQSSRRSPWLTQSTAIQRRAVTTPPRIRLAVSLIPLLLISIIIISAGGSIAYAADNAKPGDVLFQVDRAIEQIRIQFENDTQQTVRLHLQFAGERIEELIELIDIGKTEDIVYALTEYKVQIVATSPLITKAQRAGEDVSPLMLETSETIISHEKKLRDIGQTVPAGVEEDIQDTIEAIERIRKVVMSPVPVEEPVAEATPESFVLESVIPIEKSPTLPEPTPSPIPSQTTYPTGEPPSATATTTPDFPPTGFPPAEPDLISENLMLETEYPEVNLVLKISGEVKNQGTLSTGAFGVIFCVDSSVEACYEEKEGDLGVYNNIAYLAPNASIPIHTYSWLPDTEGEHIVHICADIDYSISESNESPSSNCISKTFIVLDTGLIPDLTITALDWPTEAYEDDDVLFSYRITNAGTGTARGGYLNQLFIDGQLVPNIGTQVGTRETLIMLVPGAVDSHGFIWRAKCGTHEVTAMTDVNNQLIENNDDNNITVLHTITVYCAGN